LAIYLAGTDFAIHQVTQKEAHLFQTKK